MKVNKPFQYHKNTVAAAEASTLVCACSGLESTCRCRHCLEVARPSKLDGADSFARGETSSHLPSLAGCGRHGDVASFWHFALVFLAAAAEEEEEAICHFPDEY